MWTFIQLERKQIPEEAKNIIMRAVKARVRTEKENQIRNGILNYLLASFSLPSYMLFKSQVGFWTGIINASRAITSTPVTQRPPLPQSPAIYYTDATPTQVAVLRVGHLQKAWSQSTSRRHQYHNELLAAALCLTMAEPKSVLYIDPLSMVQQLKKLRTRSSLVAQVCNRVIRQKEIQLRWIKGENPADQYSRHHHNYGDPVPSNWTRGLKALIRRHDGNPFESLVNLTGFSICRSPSLVGTVEPGGHLEGWGKENQSDWSNRGLKYI